MTQMGNHEDTKDTKKEDNEAKGAAFACPVPFSLLHSGMKIGLKEKPNQRQPSRLLPRAE
jgi:hypothetical protein